MNITQNTLDFFTKIQENNNKEWFDANKGQWENVKKEYAIFMEILQDRILKVEPIIQKEPKKYLSRINRDFRFSADKSPYRNHVWSLIERHPEEAKPRFYLQICPQGSFVATGVWQPDSDTLKRVRQEIDFNGSEFLKIIHKPSFTSCFGDIQGETLVRPPQGFDTNSPNINLLKLKQFIVKKEFSDEMVMSENFIDQIVITYQEALPFIQYLDIAVSE